MTLTTLSLTVVLFGVLLALHRFLLRPVFVAVFFGVGPLLLIVNAGRLDLQMLTWVKVFTLAVSVTLITWLPRTTGRLQRRLATCAWAILGLNILEATLADAVHGRWMNTAVGAVLIATLAGPGAVTVTQFQGRPAVRYDLPWRWIVAYTLWNFTVVAGNYPLRWLDHCAVLGAPLAATLVLGDRRYWLEARAFTLGIFLVAVIFVIDVLGWPWIPDSPSPAMAYPWLSGAAVVSGGWAVVGRIAERRGGRGRVQVG